jgi:ribosomal protein S18 acetylase RimI-like enzyme
VRLAPLAPEDRQGIEQLLAATTAFSVADRAVALELVDDVLAKAEASDYRIICAHGQAGLAGYVCFGKIPLTEASFDLYWIVVGPASRGKGIGRQLLRSAEAACLREGGQQLFAETSSLPAYGPARAFYEANGFSLLSRIANFYGPRNDRLTYGKRLS